MNVLFLISGPSGSGKTTIMRLLMQNEVVSFTTRPRRPTEVDGVDYLFITQDEFAELSASDGLVEQSEYAGNHYGITRAELDSKLAKDHAFAIVDTPGMLTLKALYPRTVPIYIYTSAMEAMKNLQDRGESEAFVNKRLSTYLKEYKHRVIYPYVIRNNRGQLDATVEIVRHIIKGECAM